MQGPRLRVGSYPNLPRKNVRGVSLYQNECAQTCSSWSYRLENPALSPLHFPYQFNTESLAVQTSSDDGSGWLLGAWPVTQSRQDLASSVTDAACIALCNEECAAFIRLKDADLEKLKKCLQFVWILKVSELEIAGLKPEGSEGQGLGFRINEYKDQGNRASELRVEESRAQVCRCAVLKGSRADRCRSQ